MTSLSTIGRGHAALVAVLILGMLPTPAGAQGPPAAEPAAPALSPPSVDLPAPLGRVLADYESAWRRKDAAALAALFAEEGFVLSSGTPPVRGRASIERHYAGAGGPLSLRAFAFAAEGRVGYILGGFARQKGEPDNGKFTLTLHQASDGRWLIVSDMDNGNQRGR
jgi:ketosteroid isomerase-like protein